MNKRIKRKRRIERLEFEVNVLKSYIATLHGEFQELGGILEHSLLGFAELQEVVNRNALATNKEFEAIRSELREGKQ